MSEAVKDIPRYLRDMADGPEITAQIDVNVLTKAARALESQSTLITELVGALDDALDDLNTDIRWADGSQLESLIERRTKLEAVLAKAKGSEK